MADLRHDGVMGLKKGARLGPYEIVDAIGAGGMGEVYRARDTRLDRSVAIKVVPPEKAASPEARQRFELEARAISSLQHPHICALHDVGCHEGIDYLVMEMLEGESLASRLERGPLPLAEALRLATQIADALAAAHRRGIVHRDLKPANVMLTRSGVKLLDFGLARHQIPVRHAGPISQGQTRLTGLTAEGTILGTLHYMAPEQLEGQAVDGRADIFAFAVVLYEMLTGARAFDGASPASLISAILKEHPPPVSSRIHFSPPELDRLIDHCLAKDPIDRWESAHDVRLQLAPILESREGVAYPPPVRSRSWLPWTVAALGIGLALAVGLDRLVRPGEAPTSARPSLVRFEVAPPATGRFYDQVETISLAVSPDGDQIAFIASVGKAKERSIWIRRLGDLEASPLPGTEGAGSLFWSPDGQSIGLFADAKLKRIQVDDGVPVVLCEVPAGIGLAGTWGSQGSILFASIQGDAIYRVAQTGGEPEVVLTAPESGATGRVVWPHYLADGERFLYVTSLPGGKLEARMGGLPDGTNRVIGPTESRLELTEAGFAIFAHDGALIAQPFDDESATLTGAPTALAPSVRTFGSTGSAAFAASRAGTIVFSSGVDASRMTWVAADGQVLEAPGDLTQSLSIRISPDGKRALIDRMRPDLATYDLWMLDLERGVETPLTSAPGTEIAGIWMPDARSIVYSASEGESPRLIRRDLQTGVDEPLLPWGPFQIAVGVTADGARLVYRKRASRGGFALWSLPLVAEPREPTPILNASTNVYGAALSPDGSLLAYVSPDSGRSEAYLRPLAGGETLRASIDGAVDLQFARDGQSLFLVTPDNRLQRVPIRTRPELRVEAPDHEFELPALGWRAFDVAPDGRLLAIVGETEAATTPLTVITGWQGSR